MNKEIAGAKDRVFQNLKLKESDIFGSTEPPIFTRLGSCLYGLYVIHRNDIEEAQKDGTSPDRVQEMINRDTKEKLVGIKEEWDEQITGGTFVSECVERQFLEILGKHHL